jgi:hypothetical protein
MRSVDSTQFSIAIGTKNRLDMVRATEKERILKLFKRSRRYVTNDDVITFLLDWYEGKVKRKVES